jgi:hypothetical protein
MWDLCVFWEQDPLYDKGVKTSLEISGKIWGNRSIYIIKNFNT